MLEVDIPSMHMRLGIVFSHHEVLDKKKKRWEQDKLTGWWRSMPAVRRFTKCTVVELLQNGGKSERCSGTSETVLSDHFNKERHRKEALKRALCQHTFRSGQHSHCSKCKQRFTVFRVFRSNPEDRKVVWDAYRERPRLATTAPRIPRTIKSVDVVEATVLRVVGPDRMLPAAGQTVTSTSGRGVLDHDEQTFRGAEAAPI